MSEKIYNTMMDYVAGADISHYEISNGEYVEGDYFSDTFSPSEDPDFIIDNDCEKEIGERKYIKVNWGEDEDSYIPADELDAELYTVYERVQNNGFKSTGQIFDTEEEVEEAVRAMMGA